MKAILVKDDIGGYRLKAETGEYIENLYVKSWKKIEDTVNLVEIEIRQIIPKGGRNW